MRITEGMRFDQLEAVVNNIDDMHDEAVDVLSGLIGIASINPNYPGCVYDELIGGESRANEYLAQHYSEAELDVTWVERVPGRANLVGVLRGKEPQEARSLALNGHVDVVPPGDLSDWTGDPFTARVEDGKVYGRGACDMKGGLVSTLLAAKAIRRSGISLRGDLLLHSVVGEETGDHSAGVKAVIDEGFGGDGAIVAESTDHHVAIVGGGLLWMTLRIKGKAGHNNLRGELVHAGGRGEAAGVNALEKGVYMVTMLQELERQWGQSKSHPLFKPGWFSLHPGVFIGVLEGIMVPFMISTSCTIDYSVLYPPNETVEEIKSEIEGFVMQACQLDPWLRKHPPEIEYQLHWPPFATSVDDPIVDTTVGAFRRAANLSPDEDPERVTGFGAVCDVTYFREAGIPAVVYGGGPPQKGHTANEHTETDRVLMAAKTYALAAMDWCGVPTTG